MNKDMEKWNKTIFIVEHLEGKKLTTAFNSLEDVLKVMTNPDNSSIRYCDGISVKQVWHHEDDGPED